MLFIGSDCRQGIQWTFAHYDIAENILLYGDSLGWEIPYNLNKNISLQDEYTTIANLHLL